ncbi:Csa1 family protein [Staphylococcus aureus]
MVEAPQIKDTFNQTLKLYPTKNLDDLDRKAFEIKNLAKETKVLGLLILE